MDKNKTIVIVLSVIGALTFIAGVFAYLQSNNTAKDSSTSSTDSSSVVSDSSENKPVEDDKMKKDNSAKTDDTMKDNKKVVAKEGIYVDYSKADFDAKSTMNRVLFFHATWCPNCRALDAELTKNTLPENTAVFKVDYDTAQELRQKYGVTLQTTLVRVDANGEKTKSYVAYDDTSYANFKSKLGL